MEDVEQQTELLSPFLLLPGKSLTQELETYKQQLSLQDLASLRRRRGVSRYVLINRLRRFPLSDPNRLRIALRNAAIGIGEWRDSTEAVLLKWPLFTNFERNIVPSFLHKLLSQNALPAAAAFPSDIFSAPNATVEFECKAGTPTIPDAESMRVRATLEPVMRRRSQKFFFLVQRL